MAEGNSKTQNDCNNAEGFEHVDIAKARNPNRKEKGSDKKNPVSDVKNKLAGLIFMCNSATKQDCFRYQVFGMPSTKMDLVQKVYLGMKLFLFDSDLKLMYGIYKAITPGGNELEQNAFRESKRSFPAQVNNYLVSFN